jgi:hypothetical protein
MNMPEILENDPQLAIITKNLGATVCLEGYSSYPWGSPVGSPTISPKGGSDATL